MTADLEKILLADEECRTRLAFAQKQLARALEDARAERQKLIEARQTAAAAALGREVAAIREEGEKQIAARRSALDAYLARLAAAGVEQLESAARTYAQIIAGDSEGASQ